MPHAVLSTVQHVPHGMPLILHRAHVWFEVGSTDNGLSRLLWTLSQMVLAAFKQHAWTGVWLWGLPAKLGTQWPLL